MKDYDIDETAAREIIAKMHIIHPYGTVGTFIIKPFGEVPSYHELVALSENIKTFTECTDQSDDDYIKMTNACTEADRIIFLGFAYHQQNLDLLFPHERNEHAMIYGTRCGISQSDIPLIKKRVRPSALNCEIVNKTCAEFFKEFQNTITFNQ